MPIYEYRCESCGHTFEVIQKVNDPPIKSCTKCSGPTNKVISAAGLMFKGSGWYINDYSSKGKPAAEQSTPRKNQEKVPDKKEEKPVTAEPAAGKKEPPT
ncbi:MAG: hypothetical protein A2Y48_07320 [Nitrospirae bacterium RIFCSPLOW2_12_42_9]|nr:MAG: hypothetical protein A2Y48_07320 [Nitrospirae bacterium RIFCSPLOW2_12_42_9]